jgi:hypothetical protein
MRKQRARLGDVANYVSSMKEKGRLFCIVCATPLRGKGVFIGEPGIGTNREEQGMLCYDGACCGHENYGDNHREI